MVSTQALMIHGGGHIMLSRDDIRPDQTNLLLNSGFLAISIDYRLCPETTLSSGPLQDVADSLVWARKILPNMKRKRFDVSIDGEKVVVVGWSTGGMLAMSLAWTSLGRGIKPPAAILAFYCPTDYEDPFWTEPNIPTGSEIMASQAKGDWRMDEEIWEGISEWPITACTIPPSMRDLGVTAGLSASNPRCRLALYMNWHGKTLNVLLNGLNKRTRDEPEAPSLEQVSSVSPLAHIRRGSYTTPTFLIHPRMDDLIPYQQSERTRNALLAAGVEVELRLLDHVPHLFDVYRLWDRDEASRIAVTDGYTFLCKHVGLSLVNT
jgi:acetyl esterase/lipase